MGSGKRPVEYAGPNEGIGASDVVVAGVEVAFPGVSPLVPGVESDSVGLVEACGDVVGLSVPEDSCVVAELATGSEVDASELVEVSGATDEEGSEV